MKDLMPGRKGTGTSQPPAELERRPGDLDMPWQLFQAIKRIDKVGDRILQMNPGTLRLRHFKEGEAICLQGEQGWTAFRILTGDDYRAIRGLADGSRAKAARAAAMYLQAQAAEATDKATKDERTKAAKEKSALADKYEGWLRELKPFLEILPTDPGEGNPGPAAYVYVDGGAQAAAPRGLFGWLWGSTPTRKKPRVINIDAPTVVDYGTRKAEMPEGALFGEWSCQYGTPRSATIVAAREIYVVEMLRNILEFVLRDPTYREETEEAYRKNVLDSHLASLSFLATLSGEQIKNEVRPAVELKSFRDGEVVFDRGDPSDCMYIVRRGIVKVLINDWPLLTNDDILDAPRIYALEGEAGKFLAGRIGPLPEWNEKKRSDFTRAVNTALKRRDFTLDKEKPAAALKGVLESPPMKAILEEYFPPRKELNDWSDQDWRRYNRLVLELAAPGAFLPLVRKGVKAGQQGPEDILAYVTAGEYFGELGAASGSQDTETGAPRTATCIAYVHPRPALDEEVDATGEKWRKTEERVELVRLPRKLLLQLMAKYPPVKKEIEGQITALKEKTKKLVQTGGTGDASPARFSDLYQKLGLVQGQKLMLIDLDRCTRCDECVQACIATHPDGRTRLHLDGPRFDKYLVPVSCRSCRDPVCMIGCPVGSIRRGNNLEMVIEDWCIGCQLCAKNCPYGSIQMHDLGLLEQEGHGWQVRGTGSWQSVRLPVLCDADLEAAIALLGGRTLEFRRDFDLAAEGGLKLSLGTNDLAARVEGTGRAAKVVGFPPVAINGKELPAAGWGQEKPGFYSHEITAADRPKYFRRGRNTISIKLDVPRARGGTLLQVALDEVRESGAVIPLKAAVCDQCSTMPDQVQACVHACPHDAAMRVDAWNNFPTR